MTSGLSVQPWPPVWSLILGQQAKRAPRRAAPPSSPAPSVSRSTPTAPSHSTPNLRVCWSPSRTQFPISHARPSKRGCPGRPHGSQQPNMLLGQPPTQGTEPEPGGSTSHAASPPAPTCRIPAVPARLCGPQGPQQAATGRQTSLTRAGLPSLLFMLLPFPGSGRLPFPGRPATGKAGV